MDNTSTSDQNKNVCDNSLQTEIQDILQFMYKKGIKLPETLSQAALNNNAQNADVSGLAADYNALVTAILPSTPESIRYIGKEFTGHLADLKSWKIPVVQKYIALTIAALIGLITLSLMPEVSAENQEKGILALSGLPLLENLLVIFFASLLGVMFYILKTIKEKIDNFTLTSVDVFSYNITIMIGIVSGFIISELFTFTQTILGSSVEVHKMTLALLGGFASDAIFSILQGMVNKIKSLFSAGS